MTNATRLSWLVRCSESLGYGGDWASRLVVVVRRSRSGRTAWARRERCQLVVAAGVAVAVAAAIGERHKRRFVAACQR